MQGRHEVGQRSDDPERIAVGDHDACVGIGPEQERQGGKVGGRLDDPARRRPLGHPLQRLQMALVPVVDRGLVDAAAPHRVLGHVVEARVHVARELVGEGEDALGGEPATVLVHGGEGGHHLVHQRDLVVAEVARGVVVGDGVQQLPQQRRAVVRVAGEQLVEQRRARAPEARHDDGRPHRLAQHGGLLVPQVDHAQPVLQDQLELAAGADAAGQMEAGLGVERRAEAPEGLLPPGVAEVVEPGRGRRLPRGGAPVRARPGSARRRPGRARERPSCPSTRCAAGASRARGVTVPATGRRRCDRASPASRRRRRARMAPCAPPRPI